MYIALKRANKSNEWINRMLWLIIYLLIAQSLVMDSALVLTVGVLFSVIYSFFAKVENVFSLLCGLSMFEAVFSIQGDNAWFAILLIFVVKIIVNNGMRINALSFCLCLLLTCLELLLDFANVGYGQLIVNISCIIFVIFSFGNISRINVKTHDIIYAISFSFFCVVYYVLRMEGGIVRYLSAFMSAAHSYRFGHMYGDTVGGAMAIPLYASLIVSCIMTYFLLKKQVSIKFKIFSFFSMGIALIVGAMTISRSFYLCLLVSFILFLVFKNRGRQFGKMEILFVVASLLIMTLFAQSDIVNKLLESLQLRMDAGVEQGTGGRTDIWIACIEYLLNNPIKLLFGSGANNYMQIGASQNKMFSAGAHNLILDLIMSWGLLGTGIIVGTCISSFKNTIKNSQVFYKHSLIPLLTYLVFSLTALRCCSLKTWIFLLITYLFIIKLNKGETYDT